MDKVEVLLSFATETLLNYNDPSETKYLYNVIHFSSWSDLGTILWVEKNNKI